MNGTVLAQRCNSKNDNICIHCGLCCDGSLFSKARINKCDDITFLKQMGCELCEDQGMHFFSLPCRGLEGTVCTLYYDKRRFKVCREFKCRLLKRYISNKISYDSAINTIREVMLRRRSLIELSQVIGTTASGKILSFIRELKLSGKLEDPSFRRTYSKHILDCLILEKLLYRKFCDKAGKHFLRSHC